MEAPLVNRRAGIPCFCRAATPAAIQLACIKNTSSHTTGVLAYLLYWPNPVDVVPVQKEFTLSILLIDLTLDTDATPNKNEL